MGCQLLRGVLVQNGAVFGIQYLIEIDCLHQLGQWYGTQVVWGENRRGQA